MSSYPRRPLLVLGALVFLGLASTANERTLGSITDEQQMLSTAVAIAETGRLGIARGHTFSIPRDGGDALSPYGMGQPLLEAPLALMAYPWERAFGPRSAQSLFVLLSTLLIVAAALGAGVLAEALGASPAGRTVAVLGTAIGSPLWAYASSAMSEPLQSACIALAAALAALSARSARGRRLAASAGLLAGWAVVTKGVNLLLLPFLAAPLLLDCRSRRSLGERWRSLLPWGLGLSASLAVWLVFEIARFGKPLSSYLGQGFTHPFLDGLWRLLIGPSKGLLLYFPLGVLGILGAVALLRDSERLGSGLAVAGVSGALLLTAAAWWAWDGTGGWGPRLLVPALPLLAAAAGAAFAGRRAVFGTALLAAGIVVNALGAFQSDPSTQLYVDSSGNVRIPESEAGWYPEPLRAQSGEERLLVRRSVVANRDAAFSPLRLNAFILKTKLTAPDRWTARQRLEQDAPWLRRFPEARPVLRFSPGTYEEVLINHLSVFRWPHLFAAAAAGEEERRSEFVGAWDVSLADQVQRALDTVRPDEAVRLSSKLWRAAPTGYSAALAAESLRVADRRAELQQLLQSLPAEVGGSPLVTLVQALVARDAGEDAAASRMLQAAARAIRTPAVVRASREPPAQWPHGLRDFLR